MRTLKQFLFLALMLCTGFACAQQTQNNSGFITSTQCVLVPAGGLNTGGYGVTGTWTGTLTAYGVVGQGAAASLGSATTNGSYTVSIAGYTLFEVCGNTVGSGAAFVQVTASSAGGGTSSGGCIATVSTLSSSCGTKSGTLASVTDGSTTSDCTVGGGTNKNACIYSGSAWAFAGSAGSAPTFAQVLTGTNVGQTHTVGSGGTLNVASGAVIDFSLIGTGTFKIPQSAGCTSSATKNICLDTTANLLHVYQNSADSTFGTGAFAAAYSLPAATNSVLGGVKPDGTTISNSSGAISVNNTSSTYFPFQSLTITGTNCASASLSGGVLNVPACTGSGTIAFPVTVTGGVSGAIPYFSSTTTESVSALLAAGHVLLGGGAGTAPSSDANLDDGQTTANTLTYGGSSGITASAGPVTAAAPSGKAGMVALGGNTANQTIPTNDFAWGGFSSASATAYGLQPPNAAPSGGQVMSFPTPTSGWSQATWVSPGGGGAAASTSMALGSGTGTAGKLACVTVTNTQGNCTALPPNNFLGVFLSGGTAYATTGIVSITIDATQNVTFGDILCASGSVAAEAHDNISTPCTNGEWVGVVTTTASSVSSVTASLRLQ